MRLTNAIKADIKFQINHGFYIIYTILTLIYIIVIRQLPDEYKMLIVPLIVFSDPSLLGFFFIGGIVMLEKEQGVLDYLIVTPLRTKEYLLAKVLSLTTLATIAGFCITITSSSKSVNYFLLLIGILLTSIFFTLYGFIVAANCNTINQYFINMIPYMLIIILPCFSLFFDYKYFFLFNIFPSVSGLNVILGAFNGLSIIEGILYGIYLLSLDLLMLNIVERIFNNKVIYKGDVI